MIQIGEQTIAMWNINLMNRGDWLAHLGRIDGTTFALDYRFRWYKDELAGRESQDTRNWYHVDIRHTSEAEALAKARRAFEDYREVVPGHEGWELIRGARSVEEFSAALSQMPGIHTSPLMSEQEFETYCGGAPV